MYSYLKQSESARSMQRKSSLLLVSVISIGIALPIANGKTQKILTIAGFQPLSQHPVSFLGNITLPAGQLAIKDINERQDILPDYNLTMEVWDTEVSCSLYYLIF